MRLGSQYSIPDFKQNLVYPYDSVSNTKNLKKALKIIIDNRLFEIKMYWVRSTYFIAVMGAILTGYFTLADKLPQFLMAAAGYLCAWVWFLSLKGSKFWQENWEHQAEEIQKKLKINIYDLLILKPTYPWNGPGWNPKQWLKAEWFSVSRLNGCLALFAICFWAIILIYWAEAGIYFYKDITFYCSFCVIAIFPILVSWLSYNSLNPKNFLELADTQCTKVVMDNLSQKF